jgi:hypothetical protein
MRVSCSEETYLREFCIILIYFYFNLNSQVVSCEQTTEQSKAEQASNTNMWCGAVEDTTFEEPWNSCSPAKTTKMETDSK